MKPKPSFQKPVREENANPQKDKRKDSGKYKLPDVTANETDLQNLNDKANGHPFSSYYKAKDNDPL